MTTEQEAKYDVRDYDDGYLIRVYWFSGKAWAVKVDTLDYGIPLGNLIACEDGWRDAGPYAGDRLPLSSFFASIFRDLFGLRGTRAQREQRAIRYLRSAVAEAEKAS